MNYTIYDYLGLFFLLCLSWMASGNDSGGCSEKTHGKQRLSEWPAVCHLRNHGCFHDPLPVRTAVQPGLSVSRLYDHRHRRRMDRRPRPGTDRPRQMVGLFQQKMEHGRLHLPPVFRSLGNPWCPCPEIRQHPWPYPPPSCPQTA